MDKLIKGLFWLIVLAVVLNYMGTAALENLSSSVGNLGDSLKDLGNSVPGLDSLGGGDSQQMPMPDGSASATEAQAAPTGNGYIDVSGNAELNAYQHFPALEGMPLTEDVTVTSSAGYGWSMRVLNYSHLFLNTGGISQYVDMLHYLALNNVTALDMKGQNHNIYVKNVPQNQHILVIVPRTLGASALAPRGSSDAGGTQTGTNGTFSFAGFDAESFDRQETGKNELRMLVEVCNAFIGSGNGHYDSKESDALCNVYATATTLKSYGADNNLQAVIDRAKDGRWGSYTFMYVNSWDAYIATQTVAQ